MILLPEVPLPNEAATRLVEYQQDVDAEPTHIRPKDLYPERAFVWTNYIYACGPCNGPKGGEPENLRSFRPAPTSRWKLHGDDTIP